MKYRILVISILASFMFACSGEKVEKEIVSTFSNGNPMHEKYFKWVGNDEVLLKEIRYFANGVKESETQYNEKGQKHSTVTNWHDNGEKWLEETYVNGVKEGDFIEWYKSGKKSFKGNYKNGIPDGTWTFWDENGEKISTKNYKDGKPVE